MFLINNATIIDAIKKHKAHFNQRPSQINIYTVYLSRNFEEIITGTPETLLKILNGFFDKIKDDLVSLPISDQLKHKYVHISGIKKKSGKIIDVELTFECPISLRSFWDALDNHLGTNANIDYAIQALDNIDYQLKYHLDIHTLNRQKLSEYKRKSKNLRSGKTVTILASKLNPYLNERLITCYVECKAVFDYDLFREKSLEWCAYSLTKYVAPRICPYCNRNFTPVVVIDKNDEARPELDHFIPKSLFPMFAVSFYNLIPACHNCNHAKGNYNVINIDARGNLSYNISHPYLVEDDLSERKVFTIKNKAQDIGIFFDYNSQEKLQIALEPNLPFKVTNSLSIYKLAVATENGLEGYYSHHDKELITSLNMVRKYPDTAIESIVKLFKGEQQIITPQSIGNLKRSLLQMVIPENAKEETLGKLKKDILTELLMHLI
ncbi:TPA: HNH endonuclease [Vibrio parahaemolyticus]|nr:HNH endonuclease [Vibrio parahaemolyticus]